MRIEQPLERAGTASGMTMPEAGWYSVFVRPSFKCTPVTQEEKRAIIDLHSRVGSGAIHDHAARLKILPFVADLMCRVNVDPTYWDTILASYRDRNGRILAALNEVFRELERNGIEKAFVTENLGALLASGTDTSQFASGDVDLYADFSQKEAYDRVLKGLGYAKSERYVHRAILDTKYQRDPEFGINIARYPFSRLKLPCTVRADSFVDWARLTTYEDTWIRLPTNEALMYICLLHISVHSYARSPGIRLYADINNLAGSGLDWERVLAFAEHDGTMVRILTSCTVAHSLLGTSVPSLVLSQAAKYGRQITRLLRAVYDEDQQSLRSLSNLQVLSVELWSDHASPIEGALKMMFPSKTWVREAYLKDGEWGPIGYLRHLANLLH